jgi:hypothetical protein
MPVNGEYGQAREFPVKALRRLQNKDLLVILQVEFLK